MVNLLRCMHVVTMFAFALPLLAVSGAAAWPHSSNKHGQVTEDLFFSEESSMATGIVGVPSAEQIMSLFAGHDGRQPHGRQRRQAVGDGSNQNDDEEELQDSYASNTGYKVETFKEALPPGFGNAHNSSQKLGCYYFDVRQKIPRRSRVHFAVLTIFRRCRSTGQQDVNASIVPDTSTGSAAFQDPVNISCEGKSGGDWLRLIVTSFVQEWFSQPENEKHRSLCLLASQTERSRSTGMSFFSLQAGNIKAGKNRHAILTVIYELGVLSDEPLCQPLINGQENTQNSHTCCRKPYYVDFEESRWKNKILFPIGYDAYTCYGWCGRKTTAVPDREETSSLSGVTRWFSTVHPQCRPARYNSVTIMFRDSQGQLHLTQIPRAVVLSCNCGQ